jgi:hypothetical protein
MKILRRNKLRSVDDPSRVHDRFLSNVIADCFSGRIIKNEPLFEIDIFGGDRLWHLAEVESEAWPRRKWQW